MSLSENLQAYHQGRLALPLGLFKAEPIAGTEVDGYVPAIGGSGYTGYSLAVDQQIYPDSIGHEFPTSADSDLYLPQTNLPTYAYPDSYTIPGSTSLGSPTASSTRRAKIFQLDFGPDDRTIDRLCWWLDAVCDAQGIPKSPTLLKTDGPSVTTLVGTDGETAPYEMTDNYWAHVSLYKSIRSRILAIGTYLGLASADRSDFWRVAEYAIGGSGYNRQYPDAKAGVANKFLWMSSWSNASIDTWDTYGKIDRRQYTRMFPGRLYPLMPQFWVYSATKQGSANSNVWVMRDITYHYVYDTPTWEAFWTLQDFCNHSYSFSSAPSGALLNSSPWTFAPWFDPYAYQASIMPGGDYATAYANAVTYGVATAAANITGYPGPTYAPGSDGSSVNSSVTTSVKALNIPWVDWTDAYNDYAANDWVCSVVSGEHNLLYTTDVNFGLANPATLISGSTYPSGQHTNWYADVENAFHRDLDFNHAAPSAPFYYYDQELTGWRYRCESQFTFALNYVDTASLRQKLGLQTTSATLQSVVNSTLGNGTNGNAATPGYWHLNDILGILALRYDAGEAATPSRSPNVEYTSGPMRPGGRISTQLNPFGHSIKFTYGWVNVTPSDAVTQPGGTTDYSLPYNGIDRQVACDAVVAAILSGTDTVTLGTVPTTWGTQVTALDVEAMLDAVPPSGKGMFFLAVHCDPLEFTSVPGSMPTDLTTLPASCPLWYNFGYVHDLTKYHSVLVTPTKNIHTFDGVRPIADGTLAPGGFGEETLLSMGAYKGALQTFTDDWERIALQWYAWGIRATANGYNGTPQSGISTPVGYWRYPGGSDGGVDPFDAMVSGTCATYQDKFNWYTLGHIAGLTSKTYGPFPFWWYCNRELRYV